LMDDSSVAVAQNSYSPYGITTTTGELANPFQYTGREWEMDGLYYYRARYYDPTSGRFISEDPIGYLGGDFNFYRYVFNSPINLIDPTGEFVCGGFCIGGIIIAIGTGTYYTVSSLNIRDNASQDAHQSGLPSSHNGPQDAYRHCLASCESSRQNGQTLTQCIAWANEKKGDWKNGQEKGERAMDDHNNAVGIAFGNSAQSYQDCKTQCLSAVNSGGLINNYQPSSTPNYYPGSAYY
ncbi:MAG: RHS repeat-associated core domain-containing protein, partial [Pseudomonadota bacterium]